MNLLNKLRNKMRGQPAPKNRNELLAHVLDEVDSFSGSASAYEEVMFLLELDNEIYGRAGRASVRYGNGVHSKHRHINYHKFFMDRVKGAKSVLDVGCSSGELSRDVAKAAAPGKVVGIEINQERYQQAVDRNTESNLEIVLGDVTKDLPDREFDIAILSNVLEHIDDRVGILKTIVGKYNLQKVLIRVPMFDRDWRVPLKRELGIDYRLDGEHTIEYTEEVFRQEMDAAGLKVVELKINWGEIWAVMEPK